MGLHGIAGRRYTPVDGGSVATMVTTRRLGQAQAGQTERVSFQRVSVRLSSDGATAEVDLRRGDRALSGSAQRRERRDAIVTATLEAVGLVSDGAVDVATDVAADVDAGRAVELRGVDRYGDVLLVRLAARRAGRPVQLVGAAWVPEHEDPAVVRAVLDAVNRFLGAPGVTDPVEPVPDPAAITAHQIRAPLALVSQTLQTLLAHQEHLGEEATRDLLERALAQAGTLLHRVDTLLGERSGRERASDVDLVAELEAAIRDADGAHPIGLHAPAAIRAVAQAGHVREIAGILLTNAVVHGRPPVDVTVTADGSQIRVVVEDAGSGVPEEQLPTLFTMTAGSTSEDGHGIGLAAARVLAETNGGTLSYRPRPGDGARFVLTLPRSSRAGG